MKRTALKKAVGLLVSTAMIVSLAGCGSKDSGSSSADSAQESAQAQAEPESSAEEDVGSQTEPGNGEQITITLWSQFSDPNSTDGNYVAFYNALESIKTDMNDSY